MNDFESILPRFGIETAHPLQKMVVEHMLASASHTNEAAPDLLAHMPTGAGKSLCFMAAGLLSQEPSLVVYPLLALMDDQLRRFQEAKIEARVIRGGMTHFDLVSCFHEYCRGDILFLLTNPEMLAREDVSEFIRFSGTRHAVIDEAHIVVQWGEDFRPAYHDLGHNLVRCGIERISAFSATAGPQIRLRLEEMLFLGRPFTLWEGIMDRPNIEYRLVLSPKPLDSLVYFLDVLEKPALVFCQRRRQAEQAALYYARHSGNYTSTRFYHAGLDTASRKHIAAWYHSEESAILFATCAYGMGVDKKNIRSVVHLGLPSSVEAFLQESGRAGRDKKPAISLCILDTDQNKNTKAETQTQPFYNYINIKTCRREFLLGGLLGSFKKTGLDTPCCDNCTNQSYPEKFQKSKKLNYVIHPSPHSAFLELTKNPRVHTVRELALHLKRETEFSGWSQESIMHWIRELERLGYISCSSFPLWKQTLALRN